jgi:hypothetical protein
MVPALEVYNPDELYEMYFEEVAPETPGEHVDLAKRLIQVENYAKTKEHLEVALEDEEFRETDQAQAVRNLIARVEVFLKAEDALKRVREVKKYAFQKRFDSALAEISTIREEYAEDEAILKLLRLERLEKKITSDRRSYFVKQVQKKFYTVMGSFVGKKAGDKEITLNEVVQWVQAPKGLAQEIFTKLTEDLGIEEEEVREFWDARTSRQVHRYNYGGGTFIHPEVAAKTRKAAKPRKRGSSRTSRGSRGGRSSGPKKAQKPKTGEEWWTRAKKRERENFAKARFAEFGNILSVLRFEVRSCTNCGGKGVLISHNAATAEEVRTICPVCNLAQHERIVICR